MFELVVFARARFELAFREGGLAQAAAEVRELIRLVLTTERLGLMTTTAAELLRTERQAYEFATRTGLDVSGWKEPSPSECLDPALPLIGYCGAVRDRAYRVLEVRPHLRPAFSGELERFDAHVTSPR